MTKKNILAAAVEAARLEARAAALEAAVDAERRLGGEEAGHYPDLRTFEAEDCRRRAAALRARTQRAQQEMRGLH